MKKRSWILAALVSSLFCASANASIISYFANLSGPAENPPNASPGAGAALINFDDVAQTLSMQVFFTGLTGTTSASHIHCCTTVANGNAGVATTTPTFAGFPLGVTNGIYSTTLNMLLPSSYNPAFVTANGGTTASALAVLLAGMDAGKSYLNIHTSTFPGGEIRGFITRVTPLAAVPLPAAAWLLLSGIGAFGMFGRRRKQIAAATV